MIQLDNGTYIGYERIGEFHSEGPWIHPSRTISSYEVILVLEGTVYLYEEDRQHALGPNEIIILEPGRVHGGSRTVEEPVAFYWLHFDTDLPMPFKVCAGQELYEVRQLMKRLLHITNTPGFSAHAADALTLVILEELAQHARAEAPANRVSVNQIAEYIRINCHKNLTVGSVAAHFSYNQDYAGKLFRKHFGVGLKEYIARQKLKLARDLLLTTDLSVKQIASELGYGHENLFIKFFLYHEKISPTAFRNQYYNTHMNNR